MAAETLVPTSAEEAVSLFGEGDGVTVIGGGTIVMPELTHGRLRPQRVLLLHKSGLDTVSENGSTVRIGAATPVAKLVGGPIELLSLYAEHIADREVRAAATVGGNTSAPPSPGVQRGDLGAALIALGARVRSTGKGGERTEPVEDFLAGQRSGRLVLEIDVDKPSGKWATEGMRRRHAHSYAIANVAACETSDGLRIGVSGVGGPAVRARAAEQSRNPDDVLQEVQPVDDAVASAEYRRQVLPILLRRVLEQLESS
jgi:aerobic carbon-monoxide dehydrogenase medium subunit